ncbi:MAG: glycosyltransferase [Bryobacterales bacterium]|nr:glycosyltransferase [Bryobacterales bacterium]
MRIALYYPWIHLTSGAERVIIELVRRSRHQYTVYTNHFDRQATFPELAGMPVTELSRLPVKRTLWTTARNSWKLLWQKLPAANHEHLVVLCEGLGDLVLFRNSGVPATCLCLTPLRACFDPHYRAQAFRQRSLAGRLVLQAGTAAFARVDRALWKRYGNVVCISGEVRKRVIAAGLAPESKIRVAYPGVGVAGNGSAFASERYFLLPGRIMWTKNHKLAIEAFRLMRSQHPELRDFRLVIAGMVDHKSGAYFESLRALCGGDSGFEFRVSPPDEELVSLYQRSFGVLFTAFNEDWGIVPLEAMSFSKPVVAVNRGGPRETVIHETNGLLAEPDPQAFSTQMSRLALAPDWAAALGHAGAGHWRRFNWDEFVSQVDRAVEGGAVRETIRLESERYVADPEP